MSEEFGSSQAPFLLKDIALQELSDLTGAQALRDGIEPAVVWRAICIQLAVPKTRWHGTHLKQVPFE